MYGSRTPDRAVQGTLTAGIMKDDMSGDYWKKILNPKLEERTDSDNNKNYSSFVSNKSK
jgi:hypothetical protein